MSSHTHRPSPALVVSVVALVVALGGTSYAAVSLPRDSIGSAQLKPKSVGGSELASGAVTSRVVRDSSLLAKDFRPGQLPRGAQGTAGAAGPTGPTGAKGDRGEKGDPAADAGTVGGQSIAKVVYRATAATPSVTVFSAKGLTISAVCAAGAEVSLTATTSKQASIYAFAGSDGDPANPLESDLESGGFAPAVPFDLIAGGNGNIDVVHFEYDAPDGTVATGTLVTDETVTTCSVTGHVIAG